VGLLFAYTVVVVQSVLKHVTILNGSGAADNDWLVNRSGFRSLIALSFAESSDGELAKQEVLKA